ncbi:MAG: hypothetical protein EOP04_02180 [Proteobacteria bacterium]|nr:MAG: hypothetical protein EOP04_02180 [Pseudomonadota bacterium]
MENTRISDRLNLWMDREFRTFNGESVKMFAKERKVTVKTMAKDLGITRSQAYQQRVPVRGLTRSRLIDLTRVIDNSYHAFKGNLDDIVIWLFSPNRKFSNKSPFVECMSGNGEKVFLDQEGYVIA